MSIYKKDFSVQLYTTERKIIIKTKKLNRANQSGKYLKKYEIDEIVDEINNQINKIKHIKNKLKNVDLCCSWRNKLIKECDDIINKY